MCFISYLFCWRPLPEGAASAPAGGQRRILRHGVWRQAARQAAFEHGHNLWQFIICLNCCGFLEHVINGFSGFGENSENVKEKKHISLFLKM